MTIVAVQCRATILLVAVAVLLAQKPPSHPYYPLAAGNSWQYTVHPAARGKRDSKIVWRVTKIDPANSGRVIYQVWPTPMQADDEAMQLTVSELGLEDVSSRTLVLKSTLSSGEHWLGAANSRTRQSRQSFKVTSVGRLCSAGSIRFQDCVVVEELDPGTQMRTVTTYARGVGPVEYRYFRLRPNASEEPLQTVTLDSYKIEP
jgi:hypothetical protein